jgi:3-hydroxyacyl-CoA dehydrogenase
VVLDTLELGLAIKKTPVVVGNCTGFAVNRVFFPYTMAAALLVDLGLDPYVIDKVIKGMFGMPMGPFRLSDLVWPMNVLVDIVNSVDKGQLLLRLPCICRCWPFLAKVASDLQLTLGSSMCDVCNYLCTL